MSEKPSEPFMSLPAQPRRVHMHDAQSFVGPGRTVVGRVAVRSPTKREELRARFEAEQMAMSENGGKLPNDLSIVTDYATISILHKCVRDADHPAAMAAFPSPGWMAENFTADELGVLLNLVHAAARADSPVPKSIDEESVETFVAMLAAAHDTDAADAVCARLDRAWLESFAIVVCRKLTEARALAASLMPPPAAEETPDAG